MAVRGAHFGWTHREAGEASHREAGGASQGVDGLLPAFRLPRGHLRNCLRANLVELMVLARLAGPVKRQFTEPHASAFGFEKKGLLFEFSRALVD